MNKYIFSDIVFFFCVTVLSYFLYYNNFGSQDFKSLLYFLCFKHTEFLLVLLIAILLKGKRRMCWVILASFYFVRCVWQWWEFFAPIPANSLYVLGMLFAFLMVSILFIIFIADGSKLYIYLKKKFKWLN